MVVFFFGYKYQKEKKNQFLGLVFFKCFVFLGFHNMKLVMFYLIDVLGGEQGYRRCTFCC